MSPSLTTQHSPHQLRIDRADGTPLLTQNAAPNKRPFIHPIIAPDGDGILTENEPGHHLWQHGLYIGLNDVNGVGFWTEGLYPPHTQDGSFAPRAIENLTSNAGAPQWRVTCDYLSPQGQRMLTETQQWRLVDRGDTLLLDLHWTLTAAVDLQFGQYAYGGLFLRMPFRSAEAACALNSERRTDTKQIDGARARWAAVSMEIPGRSADDRHAGMAILDHPANPEHPSPWRLDSSFGLNPARCVAGVWSLASGEAASFRYGVLVFTGRPDSETIEAASRDFSSREKVR